jgi:hypothetical protein
MSDLLVPEQWEIHFRVGYPLGATVQPAPCGHYLVIPITDFLYSDGDDPYEVVHFCLGGNYGPCAYVYVLTPTEVTMTTTPQGALNSVIIKGYYTYDDPLDAALEGV